MAAVALSGGRKLEAYLKKLEASVKNGGELRMGFLEGATYPDGTSVALVAAVQNFGSITRGIPPRPFFSWMIRDHASDWGPALGEVLKASGYDVTRALGLMGQQLKGELQQAIRDFDAVPLAPATIAAKGFDKQLIDTSHMLNSVDYTVIDTEEFNG